MFFIKDLKDLENITTRAAIDIKVLKDLKRHLLTLDNAGDRPPRYGKKRHFIVGRGPSDATRASERVSLAIVREPGPVSQDRPILTRL